MLHYFRNIMFVTLEKMLVTGNCIFLRVLYNGQVPLRSERVITSYITSFLMHCLRVQHSISEMLMKIIHIKESIQIYVIKLIQAQEKKISQAATSCIGQSLLWSYRYPWASHEETHQQHTCSTSLGTWCRWIYSRNAMRSRNMSNISQASPPTNNALFFASSLSPKTLPWISSNLWIIQSVPSPSHPLMMPSIKESQSSDMCMNWAADLSRDNLNWNVHLLKHLVLHHSTDWETNERESHHSKLQTPIPPHS